MEESAQILEVETFIPMLLQNAENGVSRIAGIAFICPRAPRSCVMSISGAIVWVSVSDDDTGFGN